MIKNLKGQKYYDFIYYHISMNILFSKRNDLLIFNKKNFYTNLQFNALFVFYGKEKQLISKT